MPRPPLIFVACPLARDRTVCKRGLTAVALAAVIFLPAICGSAAWPESGLLLGLGRPCLKGQCETLYRTLWIAPRGGTVQIAELPDLILPRRVGFWRAGVGWKISKAMRCPGRAMSGLPDP